MKRMHKCGFGALMVLAAAVGAQEQPSEPRYWLEQGEGYPVCQDFLANLNAFPPEEPPLMCEQKIHPTHPEFSQPVWEEMDIEANLNLIFEAESLLTRFTRFGTQPRTFEEWESQFRSRVNSGRADPRLRRTGFMQRENEPETFIWYEPVRDECRRELERTGVTGGPGGHLFVLRARTGRLEAINGATQGRNDVLIYRAKYLYLTGAFPDYSTVDGERKPVYVISTSPVIPPLVNPNGEVPFGARYGYAGDRCHVATSRAPR